MTRKSKIAQSGGLHRENHKSKIFWFTFTSTILIAFFFRFYHLADHPLGIFFDPAINGLDAIRLMQRGGHVIFFPTNGGRESFFMYLLIPFIWLFDTTPFSIRALTSTISLLNVVFLFAFLYHLPLKLSGFTHYSSHTTTNYRFWLATLGTLALATSYWHIAVLSWFRRWLCLFFGSSSKVGRPGRNAGSSFPVSSWDWKATPIPLPGCCR